MLNNTCCSPVDLGLLLNTDMAAQNCLQPQFQGIQNPLLASSGTRYTWCTHIYKQTLMHIKNKNE